MKRPRQVEVDWLGLKRAFERFDPTWDGGPLPYLNLRTGLLCYFGEVEGVDLADTLDFDRHVAVWLSAQVGVERHARMRAFVATVGEADLSERLRLVLAQEDGVGGFYRILAENPTVAQRWQRVESPRVQEQIDEWLEAEQLQPSNLPPWKSE